MNIAIPRRPSSSGILPAPACASRTTVAINPAPAPRSHPARFHPRLAFFPCNYVTFVLTYPMFGSHYTLPPQPPPANSRRFSTCKTPASQPPLFSTLTKFSVSAHSKRLKLPLESALTEREPVTTFRFSTYEKQGVPPSHPVRHRSFHPLEEHHPAKKDQQHRRGRRQQARRRRPSVSRQRPPEPVNHPRHRIQPVQPPPPLRHQRTRIRHRRSEHPELQQKWDYVLHIAIQRVQRGKPQPHAQRRQNRQQQKKRQQRKRNRRPHSVIQRHTDQHRKPNGEIHQPGKDRGKRQHQPRKKNFRDHPLIFHDDVRRVLQRVVEIHPWHQRRKIEHRIRQSFRRQLRQPPEEQSEH